MHPGLQGNWTVSRRDACLFFVRGVGRRRHISKKLTTSIILDLSVYGFSWSNVRRVASHSLGHIQCVLIKNVIAAMTSLAQFLSMGCAFVPSIPSTPFYHTHNLSLSLPLPLTSNDIYHQFVVSGRGRTTCLLN